MVLERLIQFEQGQTFSEDYRTKSEGGILYYIRMILFGAQQIISVGHEKIKEGKVTKTTAKEEN